MKPTRITTDHPKSIWQQQSPSVKWCISITNSRPLCLPVLGNVEALNLARGIIYLNLRLPVCVCSLLLFAGSWAQLPDSDGAIFRPWRIRFANWGESDAVDRAMVSLVTCCFQRNTTISSMGIVTIMIAIECSIDSSITFLNYFKWVWTTWDLNLHMWMLGAIP